MQVIDERSTLNEVDLQDDADLNRDLVGLRWNDTIPRVLQVLTGPLAGRTAFGLGSNMKKRVRSCRIALVVAILLDHPERSREAAAGAPFSMPMLEEMVSVAHRLREDGAQAMPRPSNHQGSSTQASASEPTHHSTEPPRAMADIPVAEYMKIAPGAPVECCMDPWAELRDFPPGTSKWPYCTLCSCWSDSAHIRSTKHLRRLQINEPRQAFQPRPPPLLALQEGKRAPDLPSDRQRWEHGYRVAAHLRDRLDFRKLVWPACDGPPPQLYYELKAFAT